MNKRGRANSWKKCRDLSSNGCLILSARELAAGKRTIGSICSKFVTITITVVDASGGGWKRGRNGDETRGVGSHETRGPVTSVHAFSTWKNFVHTGRATNAYRYFDTEGCVKVKRGGTAENTGTVKTSK